MPELALLTGFCVTGTQPHADHCRALLLETPVGARDFNVETLKHTRLSSWLRYAIDQSGTLAPDTLLPGSSGHIGMVSASRYGCVRATDETRKGQRAGGILGVDPIRFAKATHVYPLAANAIDLGWRGPMTAFVGDDETGWHALLFAKQQLANDAAGLMYVVTYDEIDAAVLAHLRHSGVLGGDSDERAVAEGLSVVALGRADRFPGKPTIRVDVTSDVGESGFERPVQAESPAKSVLGSSVIHWLASHAASRKQPAMAALHTQRFGGGLRSESVPQNHWRVRITPRRAGEKK